MKQGRYARIFRPEPQRYCGFSGNELEQGRLYEDWVVNDHCHIQDDYGKWHMFGITHPRTSVKNCHEGEFQLFHAVADSPTGSYTDLGSLLPPSERPGERPEIHSPYIVRKDGLFYMLYGPGQFRLAKSADLMSWELLGPVVRESDAGARDPQILFHDGKYILCYCMFDNVYCRISDDLFHWSERRLLLEMPEGISPESPFLYYKGGIFHLLVCLWDGVNDKDDVEGVYQTITHVYASKDFRRFSGRDFAGTLRAHAPELLEYEGKTYLTSAFYPWNGISIAQIEL